MPPSEVWLSLVFGILLRLLVPITATILVAWVLHRLDTRWREEGMLLSAGGITASTHCWEAHGCTPEQRSRCKAARHPDVECWEAFSSDGQIQEACRGCAFRKAKLAAIGTF